VRRENPRNLLTCIGAENFISIVDAQFDSFRGNNVWILKYYINKNLFAIQRNQVDLSGHEPTLNIIKEEFLISPNYVTKSCIEPTDMVQFVNT
jgi:hypothetical protein